MDPSKLNWLAVGAAALATFLLGGIWYSPALFGRAWQRETGLSDAQLQQRSLAVVFGTSFVLALIMAFNLAAFLQGPPDLAWGMAAGALAGIGWVAMAMGVTYLFEARSMKLFLINAGYHAVSFVIMGAILGVWK
ncbi:MAG: DUF1761 domain-containing protein [Bryobacterales bacterium]|nr:DUF1761 domain-containing protein [Bryobacterales bacterium]